MNKVKYHKNEKPVVKRYEIKEAYNHLIKNHTPPLKINERYNYVKMERYVKYEFLRYHMFPKKCFCWIDANYLLPGAYDLVTALTDDGKLKRGWFTGTSWEGANIKQKDCIIAWHRAKESYDD